MAKFLMNSAVIPAGKYGDWKYERATWRELAAWMEEGNYESRICYQDTANLIEKMTGRSVPLSRDLAEMQEGDEAMVVRMRYRLAKSMDPADWEVGRLEYYVGE